ncbi:DUF58 domain-containing protein [Candidatus Woesearchaeota archaeon]|nr:DUF58 domain-containing protein [Candidatus Woesearchaeota archaeon]
MITTEFLSSLDKFNLIVHKRVTSKYTGKRESLYKGKGSTVKDHRIYAWGDDFRAIDWRIYARTDDLYIKVYEEERNLTVHVIVDRSASMNYGKPSKFDYAAMLGVGFAYLALKDNEKFQFATFSDKLDFFQPRRGLAHLAAMTEYLNKTKTKGVSQFTDTMRQYKKILSTKSMIVIISDFLYDVNDIKEGLLQLGDNNIKVIQVLAAGERHLDIEGDVKLEDSETHGLLRTFISPRTKSDYENKLEHHIAAIGRECAAMKADFHVVTTDTPIFDSFYQILSKEMH